LGGDAWPSIYYTTDGSAPTSSSTLYKSNSEGIAISSSETVKAIAVVNGYSSDVASVSYVFVPTDFQLAAQPGSLTLSPGGQGSLTLTVTPQNLFSGTVTFLCSGLPAGVTCTFSPATVTPSTPSSVTNQLTIAASATAEARPRSRPGLPIAVLSLAGCIVFWRRKRLNQSVWTILIACAAIGLMSSCGGGGSSGGSGGGGGGSSPVTSAVTVTATSGSLVHSTTFSLTVD
jgi:hypothetical protein